MTQHKPIDKTFQDLKTKIGRAIIEHIQEGLLTDVTSKNGVSLLSDDTNTHITAVSSLFKTTLKLNKDGQTGYLIFEKQPLDLITNMALMRICTKNQKTSLLDDYKRFDDDYLKDFGWHFVNYVPLHITRKRRLFKDKLLISALVPEDQYNNIATSVKQANTKYSVSQTLPSNLALNTKSTITEELKPESTLKSLTASVINLTDGLRNLPSIAYKDYYDPNDINAVSKYLNFNKTLIKGYEAEISDLQNNLLKTLEACGRDIVANL